MPRGTVPKDVAKKAAVPPLHTPPTRAKPDPTKKVARKASRNKALADLGLREETDTRVGTEREVTKRVPVKGKRKYCGAKNRGSTNRDTGKTSSGSCKHPSGWGTSHPGFGKCKLHGGNSPNMIKSAEKEMVNERMVQENILYGAQRDIGPHEALLEEVQRTAGHVTWLEAKIRKFTMDSQLTQATAKDGMKESEWILMYQTERRMLVAVCNTAIRAGIAERTVRIAEDQGKLIAALLLKFINNPVLALTPQQMAFAPNLARDLLMELASPQPQLQQRIIGNEIVDAEVVG